MYRSHLLLLAIASAGALLLSTPAGAGQASTSFQVTATVGQACTLSANDLAFGPYTGTAVSGQTLIDISCDGGVPVGSLTLASSSDFVMVNQSGSAGTLDYDLYRDDPNAPVIVSGQDLTVGPSDPQPMMIFGEIPGGQAVPDGSYSDTVSVVFNF